AVPAATSASRAAGECDPGASQRHERGDEQHCNSVDGCSRAHDGNLPAVPAGPPHPEETADSRARLHPTPKHAQLRTCAPDALLMLYSGVLNLPAVTLLL